MNNLRRVFISIIFSTTSLYSFSQGSTNSPYSYYGIGEFEISDHSRTSGMGGVGIGMRANGFLNYANPASYSSTDSLFFVLDVAMSGNMSRFESASTSYRAINGNLKKLALGLRFNKNWGISAGVIPYTNVGYKTTSTKNIEGQTETFTLTSEGNGGLSKLYLGNSVKIGKHFSIGVNSNILLGYYEKKESYSCDNSTISADTWQKNLKFKPSSAFSFDFGTQFTDSLNSNWEYTVGIVGGINNKLQLLEYESYESSLISDDEEYVDHLDFWIPSFGGVGFSLSSSKWLFGADYKFQNWESLKKKNDISALTNSHHVAIGAQYCPRAFLGKNIFERMSYQLGAHFDRSYLKINNDNFDTYGISAGLLIPIKNQLSVVGLSVDVGKKGRLADRMFKENYIQVNLSLNFADIWFQKRRFN
ncbi:MAG: hypothetical protein AB7S48_02990 [Bacteroidales bacterium]